jgi:DNA polymerase-3 subunit beta
MSFTIQKKALFELLAKAYPIAPAKSSLQILSNIKLSCTDGELQIMATDLDHSIKSSAPISGSESFEVAVNARKLFDIVREMPEGEVNGEIDENVLGLQSEKGFSCRIAGTDIQDFPQFPDVGEGTDFQISIKDFRRLVQKSSFAVSKDTSRSCLCGVLWEVDSGNTCMIATDGHRLGSCGISGEFAVSQSVSGIVSAKTLQHLARILDEERENSTIAVSMGEKYVLLKAQDFVLCSKLIEGPYPDYEKVIPKENPKVATVDKALLVDAVRRVSILSNQKTHLVKFPLSKDSLEIVVLNRDIGGEAREVVPIGYDEENHVIGFNAQYFLEILNIIEVPTVRLEMNTQISACLILPEGEEKEKSPSEDLFLIMPLRIVDET